MPEFCRHGRFVQNCRICSPKADTPAARSARADAPAPASRGPRSSAASRGTSARRPGGGLVLKRAAAPVGAADGYGSPLVPGLRSSADARRLADELAFATARLAELAADPPGLYADAALGPDVELAFLIAYLGPLAGDDPWAGIRAARDTGSLEGVPTGPRTSHDPAKGSRTAEAFDVWAAREGALVGEAAWSPERRFDRLFERLALPGFDRGGRFELLVSLGRLGLTDARPSHLHLGGDDQVTLAAKRVFGIGEKFELDRRASALADAAGVPLAALDLALWNLASRERATMGSGAVADPAPADRIAGALGL
jgi:hypothetical protein